MWRFGGYVRQVSRPRVRTEYQITEEIACWDALLINVSEDRTTRNDQVSGVLQSWQRPELDERHHPSDKHVSRAEVYDQTTSPKSHIDEELQDNQSFTTDAARG